MNFLKGHQSIRSARWLDRSRPSGFVLLPLLLPSVYSRSAFSSYNRSPWRPRVLSNSFYVTGTCSFLQVNGISGRYINTDVLILPPLYFISLLASLWVWKCFMMVIFQDKIIYMPGLPPNARMETIADYASQCRGVQWKEHRTRASDGTNLSLCVASVEHKSSKMGYASESIPVYILHFHGVHVPYPS